ncbi:MAG: ATP-dependent Clp protease ATP-binding subunit [bacterium]|nr:ATP-dependent Clp protease ATP-binding subunit [bacterium]
MTYEALQQQVKVYRGALLTEAVISGTHLHTLEKCLRIIAALALIFWGVLFCAATMPIFASVLPPAFSEFALAQYPLLKAFAILFVGLWLIPALWYCYFASYYFRDAEPILHEFNWRTPELRFEIAAIASSGFKDPLIDFFMSRFGGLVSLRLGLSREKVIEFLKGRTVSAKPFEVIAKEGETLGLGEFTKALLVSDEGLQHLLASGSVEAADLVGAAEWVTRMDADYKEHLRWWSKDALGRIPGIGKDWAYGEIELLRRYALDITLHPAFLLGSGGAFGKREAEEIERVLSRGREANVLIIGEQGVPKLAPLVRLAKRISAGTVLPPIEHKHIFVFDGVRFVAAMKEKTRFETELTRLLSEVARAGNIIFVFDNFDAFFESAVSLGSDVLSVLDPFFSSPNIQIVAISEIGTFHRLFEQNPKIKERFERVIIEGAGVQGSIPVLESEALRAEVKEGVLITYPALRAVAESADRYFFEGIMPDKAIDLLSELIPKIKTVGKRIALREDVLELISQKTGIKVSQATGEERSKLLKLEEILHERIVGQDEAVKAISGALRRARSGIGSPNRPMGSFLFLGPTGVGKTETTKALAQVFFDDEKNIVRLDMSEYQSADALNRLIGTFEGGKVGVLASLLREHPYGVLLLDEFEKTNKDVHDLFLQILDEGFFTDVSGKRVNARNLIIIATSNAGSDLIWKLIEEKKELQKDIVITEIINRAIFKPELLNRFDGVILFRPLDGKDLRVIAKLQLQKLGKRLQEKGLELVITDPMLDFLVSVGQDPKFGARPMNRAIQEHIEQVIAEKMLRGEVAAGSKIELSTAELTVATATAAAA